MVSVHPRLLPWPGLAGQRSYLVADDNGGILSRLADEMEEVQLTMGAELLDHATEILGGRKAGALEFRFLSTRLCEALRDALRVAESRGGLLAEHDDAVAESEERQALDDEVTE
ncbi:hypothetical protein ADK47_23430 [Streptomyces rimosus subsp. rimosus]|uniref:Uncharacterized protein n=2 Tax=Streptomyces rimosus subsp. rimosus TaxID=132474 RepID=L8EVU4_STRR1|nr:hypothetical protein [Streptomyces rimosus]KOG71099.1 hypothetical protein ADK78_26310 [Kitasatospora aureofaciens]KOT33537.1 hypothetical protein ADK84_25800 [Streptomyces sp. NRRL WC-3701]MYT45819.1 hypothetical protein [Streptomyces sp. SID5471]QGY65070.1 hypothetical protein V519_003385 [Streptomyces rimosus R6-500]KEF02954.1 hypothetical protein DF17_31205 [Streptomyces rimosus]